MRPSRIRGFSLIETLVVMAIIAILMALYLPVLAKAMRKAEEVAVKEGGRQQFIGRMADNANSAGRSDARPDREACRAAFRRKVDDVIATEVLYVVTNDDEFRAYYYTIINPAQTGPLVYSSGGEVIVQDDLGNSYTLPAVDNVIDDHPTFPLGWEFISTNLQDTSSGTIGTNVLYSDGHVVYVRYPEGYPASPTVAELSHHFVENS